MSAPTAVKYLSFYSGDQDLPGQYPLCRQATSAGTDGDAHRAQIVLLLQEELHLIAYAKISSYPINPICPFSLYIYIIGSPQQVAVAHLALLPANVEVSTHLAFDLHEIVAGRSGSVLWDTSGGRGLHEH